MCTHACMHYNHIQWNLLKLGLTWGLFHESTSLQIYNLSITSTCNYKLLRTSVSRKISNLWITSTTNLSQIHTCNSKVQFPMYLCHVHMTHTWLVSFSLSVYLFLYCKLSLIENVKIHHIDQQSCYFERN